MVDRIEKVKVGRYSLGSFRFVNKDHYDSFKKAYPSLSEFLDPPNLTMSEAKEVSAEVESDLNKLKASWRDP